MKHPRLVMKLSSILLALILSNSVQTVRGNPQVGTQLWQVKISVDVSFPAGFSAWVHADLIYPSEKEAVLTRVNSRTLPSKSGNINEAHYEFLVTPKSASASRPSHVILNLRALGFEKQVRNTGILSYSQHNAATTLQVRFEGYNGPHALDSPIIDFQTGKALVEINVFNPMDSQLSITRITFQFEERGNGYFPDPPVTYEIRLQPSQRTAQVTMGGAPASYPVEWQRETRHSLQANLRANLTIPAKANAILRFYFAMRDRSTTLTFSIGQKSKTLSKRRDQDVLGLSVVRLDFNGELTADCTIPIYP